MKGILRDELIGLEAEVINAKNKDLIGIKGRIIDETKYTLVLDTDKGIKKVLKAQATFKLPYKGKNLAVEGKLLIGRPYERLRK